MATTTTGSSPFVYPVFPQRHTHLYCPSNWCRVFCQPATLSRLQVQNSAFPAAVLLPGLSIQMSSATTSTKSTSMLIAAASVCMIAMVGSTIAAPTAAGKEVQQPDKRGFDSFNSRGFTGFDKRAFDSLASRGFRGFDKRAFDSFAGTFSGLDKRSFDSFNSRGFTGFDKRSPFDSFVGSGFTGMDKRNAFDSFNSRGFTGFDKRAFDSFNSRGFTGFD